MRNRCEFTKRDALRRPREPTANPELCPLFLRQPDRAPTHVLPYPLGYYLGFQLSGEPEPLEAQLPTEPTALQRRTVACRACDRAR